MPKPRAQQVSLAATAYYHCISRCVRRAFLCGHDRLTGKSFDHRKQWLVERMLEPSDVVAIEICAYGLMSSHFHVILHVDRGRALGWTDAEVAARYARLFRHTVIQVQQLPEEAWQRTVARWRAWLWDLSWFMRCLNEANARRANPEDHCTGRFWEGRFRSQALLDEGALLTCMSYVDLNPIRAGTATSLEESQFTSIRDRLLAAARGEVEGMRLVPFADQAGVGSDPLPLGFADYVELLRCTTAGLTGTRSEAVAGGVGASLARLGLERTGFVDSVRRYAQRFFTMVGHAYRIDVECRRRGYRRRPGLQAAQQLYRATAA